MTSESSANIEQAVYNLARRVRELKPIIETEEATKTSLIMPFITEVLGYDATDPREVIPEYTADIGKKKGEKVDYAIKSGDDFRFLIEAKAVGAPLSLEHTTQLVRYFNATDCDFAILTNGEVYHFYAQLDAANRMDEKPFMTLDLANVDARIFPHLAKCTKSQFDADTINESAEELKYVAEIKKVLKANFTDPDAEWVKQITQRVTSRRMTAAVLESFTSLVLTAQSQFIRDEVNRRLRSAQDMEDPLVSNVAPLLPHEDLGEQPVTASENSDAAIVTTEEELQAWAIIRAITCSEVPASDVHLRDAKSYCAILYQDNNRKPIARLYFDRKVPRIGIFDAAKNEVQFDLESIEGIYQHADLLRERVRALRDE